MTMPAAVFLPAWHDDDSLADVVAQALAVRSGALGLYARPDDHLLAWLPRAPKRGGWIRVAVPHLPASPAPDLPQS